MSEGDSFFTNQFEEDLQAFPLQPIEEAPKPKAQPKQRQVDPVKLQKLAQEQEMQETAVERHQAIVRMSKYLKHPILSQRIQVKLPTEAKQLKMTLAELLALEQTIKDDLAQYGNDEMLLVMFTQGMGAVQDLSTRYNFFGLQLAGPNADIKGTLLHPRTQQQLQPIMAELSIKYGSWLASGPEKRLAFFCFQLFSSVHAANTAPPDGDSPVDDDIERELRDLSKP